MDFLYSHTDHVAVALDDVVVNVRCGLHPWERFAQKPNRLAISVRLYAPLGGGRLSGAPIIDYDPVRDYIRSLEKADHIDLIETIVDGVTDVCFVDTRIEACLVRVRKLDIFPETAGAGLDVFRTRAQWSAER
jgi:7,8-dihydroneopterin aldolase/epimerase/oxygenase